MAKEFVVTPWEVKGEVDYEKLIKQFGTEHLTDKLLERIKKHTGELHLQLRRKIFFSHRDLKWVLDEYEKGNKFFLYTGRGPSGHIHLGHLMPWMVVKWLQDKFGAELWFQLTDDEKFYFNRKLSLEDSCKFAYENALDIIALGFKPKKTFLFTDFDYAKTLYKQAAKVAKKLTFSTAKAVFGFSNDSNVGQIFFTSMQSVPAFLPSIKAGKNIPCLIPLGIDQDAHFRISRDILPGLGYYKPSLLHCRFLPGLGEGGKMSASQPETSIFTVDDEKTVKKKIANAFTGGRDTAEEQKKLGGKADICPIYHYYYYLFEEDDKKLKDIYEECTGGKILCGACKARLTERIVKFLTKHQEKREKARDQLDKFIIKD
ncbi:tryptophan--tRNA ligase [Candidatus Woesearchaeota archaeon]|nr:tryptophan--tRNA ligase [Candidatus Woesearchaeota archaeon]